MKIEPNDLIEKLGHEATQLLLIWARESGIEAARKRAAAGQPEGLGVKVTVAELRSLLNEDSIRRRQDLCHDRAARLAAVRKVTRVTGPRHSHIALTKAEERLADLITDPATELDTLAKALGLLAKILESFEQLERVSPAIGKRTLSDLKYREQLRALIGGAS